MGATLAEKILAKAASKDTVSPGEIVTVRPDVILSHDNTAAIIKHFRKLGVDKVVAPEKLVVILDHVVPAATETYAVNHQEIRKFVREQNLPNFFGVGCGICHQVLPEKGFARPGNLIVGADSHTTTYGAFGAFSTGLGRSEIAVTWATDQIWLRVPESYKIILNGELPPGVTSKDVILKIIGELGADGALYKAVEFSGPIVNNMSIASRMVLTNMSVEMGAKNGIIAPDETAIKWLFKNGIVEFEPSFPDEEAQYEKVLEFNLSDLVPQVAFPHTVDNVKPIDEAEGIEVDQVVLGTCTNGRYEDLYQAAQILKNKKIAENVRMLLFPASRNVYLEALKNGLMEIFIEAGVIIMNPGCGPCLGAHEGILAPGEVCLSTANRNFKGRMGSTESQIYLANPAVAAATAITGRITDPIIFM